ncbi:MAG: hypothetical protein ABIH00_05465, partial [Armatimonadota bacterium]
KQASAGIGVKFCNNYYARGAYLDTSKNYKEFLNLNSRGRSGSLEIGAIYPKSNPLTKQSLMASLNFNFGSQDSDNFLYSYNHKEIGLSINQKFTKYDTVKLIYLNQNNWYKNWPVERTTGNAFWKVYGVEFKHDFYKDWNVNVGIFKRSLISNINDWGYTKMLYTLEFNKEF